MENVPAEPVSSNKKAFKLFEDENGSNKVINLVLVKKENDEIIIEHSEIENIDTTASNADNSEMTTNSVDVESGDTKVFSTSFNPQVDVLDNIEIQKNLNETSSTENPIEKLYDVNNQILVDKHEPPKEFICKIDVSECKENKKDSNTTVTNSKIAEEHFHNENTSVVVESNIETDDARKPVENVGSEEETVENNLNSVEADVTKDKSNKQEESIALHYSKMSFAARRLFKIALRKGHTREEAIKLSKSTDFSNENRKTKQKPVEHFDVKHKQLGSKGSTTENVSPTIDTKNHPQSQLVSKNEAKIAEANGQTNSSESELVDRSKKQKLKMTNGQRKRFNKAMQVGFTREQAIKIAMNNQVNMQNPAVEKEMTPNINKINNKRFPCNDQRDSAIKRIKLSGSNTSNTSQKSSHNEQNQAIDETITPCDKGISSNNTHPSKSTDLNLIQVDFPNSAHYTNQKALTFLGAQNSLKTDMWKVVKRRSDTTILTLHIQVDDNSWAQLTNLDGIVSYRFGELKLNMKNIDNDSHSSSAASTSKHVPTSQNDLQGKEPKIMHHRCMAALSYENNEEL